MLLMSYSFRYETRRIDRAKYRANKITVKNTGRSATKDCKAYVGYNGKTRRVPWLLPDKNSGYTISLNVKDKEFVDFCAISEVDHTRIIPLSKDTLMILKMSMRND